MNRRLISISCLLLSLTLAPSAWALLSDSAQILHIESDTFTYEDAKSVAVYQGHVIATQGSRYLTADRVIISLTPSRQVSKVNAYGNPAHYHYQPNPGDNLVYASADNIQYDPSKNLLSLIKNGTVQQNGNVFKGSLITYNTLTQTIQSNGTQTPGSRPLMIIQPHTQQQVVTHAS
jgi:lipopolysaccharide export system protein LptA